MNGGGYADMAIPIIKRHNLDGYKKIVMCKSCGYADLKYPHP